MAPADCVVASTVHVPTASAACIWDLLVLPSWSSFSCSAVPEALSPCLYLKQGEVALDSRDTFNWEDCSSVKL